MACLVHVAPEQLVVPLESLHKPPWSDNARLFLVCVYLQPCQGYFKTLM